MFPILALLFLAVPFVELFVILQVGQAIGVLETVALLVLVSVVGAWLVKREGMGVLRKAQRQVALGRVPANELVDAVFVLFAGALLLTPGFVTDALAVALLLPPVRVALRGTARRWIGRRVVVRRPPR